MSTTTTTPPPVHHYEENFSRSHALVSWLKGQYALGILAALLVIATITRGSIFWGATNMTNLLLQMSIIGVVVLAQLIVVLTGGIDISVGSALGLAAVVAAGLFGGPSVLLGLLVALVIGGIIGATNGWLVAFRGLEPFIVTLGMLASPAVWSTRTAVASRSLPAPQRRTRISARPPSWASRCWPWSGWPRSR